MIPSHVSSFIGTWYVAAPLLCLSQFSVRASGQSSCIIPVREDRLEFQAIHVLAHEIYTQVICFLVGILLPTSHRSQERIWKQEVSREENIFKQSSIL